MKNKTTLRNSGRILIGGGVAFVLAAVFFVMTPTVSQSRGGYLPDEICRPPSEVIAIAGEALIGMNSYIPAPPPGVKAHVAYMSLHNPTKQAVTITGLSSEDYKQVQIHQTIIKEGIAVMKQRRAVVIKANGRVDFTPQGMHIMLMGPVGKVKTGDKVRLLVSLSNGQTASLSVPITKRNVSQQAGHHQHH